jgi:hypothetical protein
LLMGTSTDISSRTTSYRPSALLASPRIGRLFRANALTLKSAALVAEPTHPRMGVEVQKQALHLRFVMCGKPNHIDPYARNGVGFHGDQL